jgi:cytochrome bd ubiquinol oxidase subunit I
VPIVRLDPEHLSRLQFAWVVGWHILLPAFTVGLASFIAFLEGAYALTKRHVFLHLSQFWLKIFAISFAMGVVTGIVMPFQFGTNWSRLSDAAGNIISPLLAYEGLTAFFLEATFLGVLLFGRKLVPPSMHFVAAVLVAVGTLSSSFWILATNSWMQTPSGYQIIDGRFFPKDWFEIVFSPSFPFRLAHTVSAFYVTTAFVVLGVGAYTSRRGQFVPEGRMMLRLALWFLAIFVPLQIVLGDMHGLNTLAHQPAKLAAMEGLWDGGNGVPASIIGWPDQTAERNIGEIAIPHVGSLYLTHSWDGAVKGLKDFPPDQRPPVAIVYFAFRIMVGVALLMLATVVTGFILMARGQLDQTQWYLRLCQITACLGFIAVIAGWTTTEVGRQPWTVYGLMRTADSVSPSLTGPNVLLSLLLYIAVYLVIYPVGLTLMLRLVWRGPVPTDEAVPIGAGHPKSAIEALPAIDRNASPPMETTT